MPRSRVSQYMSTPVFLITADSSLEDARRRLDQHNVSSLAVSDGPTALAGVISRTDLLRIGKLERLPDGKRGELTLPEGKTVRDVMQTSVITVAATDQLDKAAKRMLDQKVHRVFVRAGDRAAGVVSTKDLMESLIDDRVRAPVSSYMDSPAPLISEDEPVSSALAKLKGKERNGLVVVDDKGWPQGVFTQIEALESEEITGETPVGDVLNPRIVTVKEHTAIYRAAAQAAANRVRRAVVIEKDQVVGLLSGLDFARAVADYG